MKLNHNNCAEHSVLCKVNWANTLNSVFGQNIPLYSEWTSPDAISYVLNKLANNIDSTYIAFPYGGDCHLTDAGLVTKNSLIYILADNKLIINPHKLIFRGNDNVSACYFYLNTNPEIKLFQDSFTCEMAEHLVQLDNGVYKPIINFNDSSDNSIEISRHLKGDLLFFQKSSYFFKIFDLIPGIHDYLGEKGFYKFNRCIMQD